MLVLTRRAGESIRINEDIKITIVEVKGGHVRVGFEAPSSVIIQREELLTDDAADKTLDQDKSKV